MSKSNRIAPHITFSDIETYKREILSSTVLIKIPDAAAILSVSEDTVIRRIKDGRLTAHNEHAAIVDGSMRVSQGTRILAADLQAYVRSIRIDKSLW